MQATLRSEGYLRFAGWSNARHFLIEGETLRVEIARRSCQHCPVCTRRIRAVEHSLRATNAKWQWEHRIGNGLYVAVEFPKEPTRVDNYLQGLLGFPISMC